MLARFSIVVLMFVCSCGTALKKSSRVQLYAYERVTLPGAIPSGSIDESGREVEMKQTTRVTYFLFAEFDPIKNLEFTGLWLKGRFYDVTLDTVSTPVVIGKTPVGRIERADTLVTRTERHVARINTVVPDRDSTKALHPALPEQHQAILLFRIGRKEYYSAQPEIKKLEPLALQ